MPRPFVNPQSLHNPVISFNASSSQVYRIYPVNPMTVKNLLHVLRFRPLVMQSVEAVRDLKLAETLPTDSFIAPPDGAAGESYRYQACFLGEWSGIKHAIIFSGVIFRFKVPLSPIASASGSRKNSITGEACCFIRNFCLASCT